MSHGSVDERMDKTISSFENDLKAIRTGRANATVLDGVKVEAYVQMMPINQVASFNVPDPKSIVIKPFDPSTLGDIEKAIMAADLGFNPSNDGSIIRIVVPELTQERREELKKQVKQKAEDAKVAIRNIRRDENDTIKKKLKEKEISEDEEKHALSEVQKKTDSHIEKIDEMTENKEKELSEI